VLELRDGTKMTSLLKDLNEVNLHNEKKRWLVQVE